MGDSQWSKPQGSAESKQNLSATTLSTDSLTEQPVIEHPSLMSEDTNLDVVAVAPSPQNEPSIWDTVAGFNRVDDRLKSILSRLEDIEENLDMTRRETMRPFKTVIPLVS